MFRGVIIRLLVLVVAVAPIVVDVEPVARAAGHVPNESASGGSPGSRIAGRKLWQERYDGPRHKRDDAAAVAVSPDGSKVFVTGGSKGSNGYGYATLAYDASTGKVLWVSRFGEPGTASDLAVSPDGSRVFVTGSSAANGNYDFATVAYESSTGNELWVSRYDGSAHDSDYAAAVAVSPDGATVFVTGTGAEELHDEYTTFAYDASTGKTRWVTNYNWLDYSVAQAMSVSPNGSMVFVTGGTFDSRDDDFLTVAYRASTGKVLWSSTYDGPGHFEDYASALGVSPDGSTVFVAGHSDGSSSTDYATVAYRASTGKRRWVGRDDGPVGGSDYPSALGVSPDGSAVFVTGGYDGPGGDGYATVAYDTATKGEMWASRYDGPGGAASARALAVAPDGSSVFVTGAADGPNGYDYTTLAYDASTGEKLWLNRYDGPRHRDDFATGLGVAPDGSALFVTGASEGPNAEDYATVACRAA